MAGQPIKSGKDNKALIFLLVSAIIALVSTFLGAFCMVANILIAFVFLVLTKDNPSAFSYAKANLAVILLYGVFFTIVITLIVGVTIFTNPEAIKSKPDLLSIALAMIPNVIAFVLYTFLTYKCYKNEKSPFF